MSDRNEGAFIGGLLVGSAVGAIAALMLAPRSGKDTRKILKKSLDALPELAEDLADSLHLHADHLSENARRNWAGTLHRLQEAIAAGVEASKQEAQDLETPDEDLFTVPEIESPQN
jgi:gas vesicle protein